MLNFHYAPLAAVLALVLTSLAAVPSTASDGRAGKPISILRENPHYFSDMRGKPLVLVGDYTWGIFSDTDYDFTKFLDWHKARGLNLARIWLWWGCEQFPAEGRVRHVEGPIHIEPFLRTGPGKANDGKPKYDLTKFNQAFFDRLRAMCEAARQRGIYLQLITTDGWMLKHEHLWRRHAFHRDNNVNGVDGDPRNTGKGTDREQGFCSLGNPKALEFQKSYIKKVVETVNDFDNIYFEIYNESPGSREQEIALCDYIKELERGMPKQHLTVRRDFPSHGEIVQRWDTERVRREMLRYRELRKPLIFDTHWEINNNDDQVRGAMWTAIVTGCHFNYMDDSLDQFRSQPKEDRRAALHKQIDYAAAFVKRLKPWEMKADDALVKSGRAYATSSSSELAAYLLAGGSVTLDLSKMSGKLRAWWYNSLDGKFGKEFEVHGGGPAELQAPDTRDWVLLIRKGDDTR